MADSKISALPASTVPLAGTEVLPIVQSSTTKQVSIANLTAGRAVSAASLALTTTPLPATSGGTGSNSAFTANGLVYASSTSVLATGSTLTFDGSTLSAPAFLVNNDSNGITFGGTFGSDFMTIKRNDTNKRMTFNIPFTSGAGYDFNMDDGGGGAYQTFSVNGSGVNLFELYAANDAGSTYFKSTVIYNNTVGATNRDVFVDNSGYVGYVSSTRETKTNIENMDDVSWLLQLTPRKFNYRKKVVSINPSNNASAIEYLDEIDGDIQEGLIYDEVESIKKEICFFDVDENNQEIPRGISYSKIIVPLLKLVQQQQAIITQLQADVAVLKGKT